MAKGDNLESGLFAEVIGRVEALENEVADLRGQLEAAKNSMAVQPYEGFGAHVVHVMNKHFYHDKPDADDASRKGGG